MTIREKFDKWCAAERVGRFEEGTSQDMFSTNGDLFWYCIIMSIPILLMFLCFFVFKIPIYR